MKELTRKENEVAMDRDEEIIQQIKSYQKEENELMEKSSQICEARVELVMELCERLDISFTTVFDFINKRMGKK